MRFEEVMAGLPREKVACLPTPLTRLTNEENYLHAAHGMYLKRDDLTLPVMDLIAGATDQSGQQERREAEYRKKVIETFFEYGRLKAIPAQRKKERICLEEIAKALEPGRVYSEAELNGVLLTFHEDYCTLRRDMIAEGLLKREKGRYEKV